MANFKVSFAYIFGLASLIISLGIASQGKPVETERLPSPTPSAMPAPKPLPFPGAARLASCQDSSQPRFYFYIPTLKNDVENSLVISGTVYASDMSPLPNASVEVSSADFDQVNSAYPPPFHSLIRTDKRGHYEVAIMDSTWPDWSYVHYRVTYRNSCPLLLHLHLGAEPLPKPTGHIVTTVQIIGPVLQGPVDIVMPVSPAKP